jgi:tetratricopeptide (TPR) repeat protein
MSGAAALPGEGAASVEALRRLLVSAAAHTDADSPVLLTDRLVGPQAGALLRCCAVPHQFDSALLAWMGELDSAAADALYTRFTELSLMQVDEATLSVHERWRAELWRWWLAPEQRTRFAALSERLVSWFTRPADPSGEDPWARRRMFHLLGCRHDEGMAEFDRLFRAARHRRRFSECVLLLGLVREYTPVLSASELALLDYHEGKIAIDLRQWERALPLLQAASQAPGAPPHLRVNAQVRMAHAQRQLQQVALAEATLAAALAAVEANPAAAASRWRVLYEQGEIQRDQGRLEQAEITLRAALAAAGQGDDDVDVAGLHNSLGTVQLKRRDADAAVASFQASLDQLQRDGDALRTGAVLNNLALAQLERCDWSAAEAALRTSLDIKRSTGDLGGQATTLQNLARSLSAQGRAGEALQAADQAAALFAQAGDAQRLQLAQQTRSRMAGLMGGGVPTPHRNEGLPVWAWVLLVLAAALFALMAWAE